MDREGHGPGRREFDRVVQQVEQHLPQPVRIAVKRFGQARIEARLDGQRGLEGRPAHHRDRVVEEGAHRERNRIELELSGLDLRDVENVVDDGEQGLAGDADQLQVAAVLRIVIGASQQQVGIAEDAVEGRADLVADHREELALGRARPLGLRPGGLGLVGDGAQGRFRRLALGDVEVQPDHPVGTAGLVVEGPAAGMDPAGADPELGTEAGAVVDGAVDAVPGLDDVVRVDAGGPGGRAQTFGLAGFGQSVEAQALRRERRHPGAHVPVEGAGTRALQGDAEQAARILLGEAGRDDVVDIEGRADPLDDGVRGGGRPDRGHRHLVPAIGSVLRPQAPLPLVTPSGGARVPPGGVEDRRVVGMFARHGIRSPAADRAVIGLEAGVGVGGLPGRRIEGPDLQRQGVGKAAVAQLAAMDLGLDPQSVGGVHQDAEQPDGAARLPLAGPANHHVAQAAIGADEARLDLEIASIRDRGSHRRLDRRLVLGREEVGEGRVLGGRCRRVEPGDAEQAVGVERLRIGEVHPPMADRGHLLGHAQERVGRRPLLDLGALPVDRALVEPAQFHFASESAVVVVKPKMGGDRLGKVAQGRLVLGGEGAGVRIDEAERAETQAGGQAEGHARVEHDPGGALAEIAIGEARIEAGVGDDQHAVLLDRVRAQIEPSRAARAVGPWSRCRT